MDIAKEIVSIMKVPRAGRWEGVHDGCHRRQPQGAGTMDVPSWKKKEKLLIPTYKICKVSTIIEYNLQNLQIYNNYIESTLIQYDMLNLKID